MEKVHVHALTTSSKGIANCIITPVEVTNLYTGEKQESKGIWDTGATNSAITSHLAISLNLKLISKINVKGVHGDKWVNLYLIKITLNNKNISVNVAVSECDELSTDNTIGILIGMDVINKGDFSITNYQGQTTMSFRVPSLERIDFFENIKKNKK
jgi:hypothetical protein